MKKSFYTSRAAFTLLEIMIVLTIMSILMMAVYMPYAHHQKKTFREEYLGFLKAFEVEYDERYIFQEPV